MAAAVIARAGRVLVCRRRPTDLHPGKWEFPGGKIEAAESLSACIRRELREELAIECDPGEVLFRTHHSYPDGPTCDLAFVRIRSFTGAPQNRCFAEIRWTPIDQLTAVDFLEADREFARRLESGVIPLEPSLRDREAS